MEFLTSLQITSTTGFLLLGFLIGMIHAFEADHMAAISTLATENKKQLILRGAIWGVGHTITLFAMSMAVVVFSFVLTDAGAAALEFAVGVMLVLLGLDVVRRWRKQRLHFHLHSHHGQTPHIHVHSHRGEAVKHRQSAHDHMHPDRFPLKALVIGLIHGAAGSAGIIVLAAASAGSAWVALGYVALVGIGSIFGMAGLSAVVSLPIGYAPQNARWLHTGVKLAVATVAVSLGISIMLATGALAWQVF
ncbi:MAG: hypothetical protein ACC619_01505 [Paracoccaceae bacterium]